MFAGSGVGNNMAITSLRALLFTVGGVVAVGGVAYISGAFDRPPPPPAPAETAAPAPAAPEAADTKTAPGTQERIPAPAGADQAQAPAPKEDAAAPQAPEQAAPAAGVVAPTFDVVRVEGDGSAVIAGKAAPGAKVEIVHGSAVLGEATAGPDGAFAIVLSDPLKPGDYQIVLRSTAPDGVVATSEQTAVISVPEKADGQVLAMVEEPGKPAELLTVPEPDSKAQAPAAADQESSEQGPAEAPKAEADAAAPQSGAEQAPLQETAPAAEQPAAPEQPADQSAAPEQPPSQEKPAGTVTGPKVVVEAVEIDGSKVFVAGLADAGRKVRAYANDILLGDAVTSPDGHFLVEAQRDLPVGQYTVRVDALEADGKVAARATVPFEREPGEAIAAVAPQPAKPAPAETETAAADQPGATAPAQTAPAAAETAPAPEAPATAVPETVAPKLEHADGAVIIRRGDSLWRISRRVYGHGIRYSTIYLANQKQIADPDKIWPGQVFTVPEKSKEGEPADLKALGDQATTVPAQ